MKLYTLEVFAVLVASSPLQSTALLTKKAYPLLINSYRLVKRQATQQSLQQAFKQKDWSTYWCNFPYAASAVKDIFNARNRNPSEFRFIIKEDAKWSYCFFSDTFYYAQKDIAEFNETVERQIQGLEVRKRLYSDIMQDGMMNKQLHALLVRAIIGHELQHAFDRSIFISLEHTSFTSKNKKYQLFKELEYKADQHASQDPAVLEALATFLMHQHLFHVVKESEHHPPCLERAQRLFQLSESIRKKSNL